jgi:arylsulfatase A-like enzyme
LIIQWPKGTGLFGTQDYIVQNIDIFPTMVEIVGERDGLTMQLEGKSLLSGRGKDNEDCAISELIKPFGPDAMPYRDMLSQYDRRLVSVRSRDYKYIWSSNGRHEFFNVSRDPGENRNMFNKANKDEHSKILDQLVSYAKPWVDRSDALYEQLQEEIEMKDVPEIDDDIKTKLSELGYF